MNIVKNILVLVALQTFGSGMSMASESLEDVNWFEPVTVNFNSPNGDILVVLNNDNGDFCGEARFDDSGDLRSIECGYECRPVRSRSAVKKAQCLRITNIPSIELITIESDELGYTVKHSVLGTLAVGAILSTE